MRGGLVGSKGTVGGGKGGGVGRERGDKREGGGGRGREPEGEEGGHIDGLGGFMRAGEVVEGEAGSTFAPFFFYFPLLCCSLRRRNLCRSQRGNCAGWNEGCHASCALWTLRKCNDPVSFSFVRQKKKEYFIRIMFFCWLFFEFH